MQVSLAIDFFFQFRLSVKIEMPLTTVLVLRIRTVRGQAWKEKEGTHCAKPFRFDMRHEEMPVIVFYGLGHGTV